MKSETKWKTLMLILNKDYGHACEPMTKCNGHDDAWYDAMYANETKQKIGKERVNFGVWHHPICVYVAYILKVWWVI